MTQRVEAEMVANVLQIDVAEGDRVEAGQILVLLESMKMEIPVVAEQAGTVQRIGVSPGDVVQEGDLLVELGVRPGQTPDQVGPRTSR